MSSRFLLVEDEPTLQRVMSSVLSDAGHVVDTVSTYHDALARLRDPGQPDIDLVLSDKNLPDGSGIDLLASLRRQSSLTRFVLVTGYPHIDTARVVLGHGAEGYWAKPLRSLAVAVRQLETLVKQPMAPRQQRHQQAADVAAKLQGAPGDCRHRCAVSAGQPASTGLTMSDLADAEVIISHGWPDDATLAAVGHRALVVVAADTPMEQLVRGIEHGATVWLPAWAADGGP
jgi:CheY-like chemotaxis protein